MTLNYDCSLGRKLAYSLTYIGFLTYDFYQIKEIIRKTKATKKERLGFLALFFGRVVSLAYNLYYISGIIANPTTSGAFIGAGPCKTLATDIMVHQEHIYIIFMETIMIAKVVHYALSLDRSKHWRKFFKVIDFEIITFIIYLLCEIIYMGFYLTFPPTDISYFNVFYDQVSIILFMANATYFSNKKIDKAAELEAKAETKNPKSIGINSIFSRGPRQRKSVAQPE
ncbi:hypothetical protein HDV06_003418 [Boothiomyces sp. JEL0866]|nr:hypothetical protein HDV06_003370 [Boothiomyces sp. JEL0866]KAJ3325648.1 hypothetical protein HDV06_003418 [Boothiomyces sp. JEL0866]